MRLLNAAEIEAALPMRAAMKVMRQAFMSIARGDASIAERQSLPLDAGTGLLMGAAHDDIGIAAKVVSVMPGNPNQGLPGTIGAVSLMDPQTGQPLALMDGTALTAWRTAAVSGCAIDALARPDARSALLIGCGTQAPTQLVAMITARRLDCIRVHALDELRLNDFIDHYEPRVSARLEAVSSLDEAVANADIIVTVTNSADPVFDIRHLAPGCHVNGIGSFRPGMCENDPGIVGNARVFVEARDTAAAEAGELISAAQAGLCEVSDWTELGRVFAGEAEGRRDAEELTFFKSVGHAVFDLHYARAVYDAAEALRLGTEWQP